MTSRPLGYQRLIEMLGLRVRPLERGSFSSTTVNRKVTTHEKALFPVGVAVEDTPIGQIEFALRHEKLNLEIICAAFEKMPADDLRLRYIQQPNGEYIRKACFLWDWMKEIPLDLPASTAVGYLPMLDPAAYATAGKPTRVSKYRIEDNLLGNKDFCPMVSRDALDATGDLQKLLSSLADQFKDLGSQEVYKRAIEYLFLSETKGSFAIEKETPTASKEQRFVQLLSQAGVHPKVTEEWLVELQNAVIRNDFAFEASYRSKQNWLEDRNGRVTFLPPSPSNMPRLMDGWARFTNDSDRDVPLVVKLACSSFGFVYLHPFLDGNGRLHRLLIHHLLTKSKSMPADILLPVSATILHQLMPEYSQVLTGFSKPVTELWEFIKTDQGPNIKRNPGSTPYAYFNADDEVRFIFDAVQKTITEEIPNELEFLIGFDAASEGINEKMDLPGPDVSKLIRMIHSNNGSLSSNKRNQFHHLPDEVILHIEKIVKDSFTSARARKPGKPA